mgnify:CR=1 FL=1
MAGSVFTPAGPAWSHLASTVLPGYVGTTLVLMTAVLAGVCGTDPFRFMKLFLREIDAAGSLFVTRFKRDAALNYLSEQPVQEGILRVEVIRGQCLGEPLDHCSIAHRRPCLALLPVLQGTKYQSR